MDSPQIPAPTSNPSLPDPEAWPPTTQSPGSSPSSSQPTPPLPPPLLPNAKRDEPQCPMPVKTWPGGGTSSSTITVELPCGSTPFNLANIPPPPPPLTPTTVAGQSVTATPQQPPAITSAPASILNMGEGGVAAVISVLSIAVLGAAIGFYVWGRKMGLIRAKRGMQNAGHGFHPQGHGPVLWNQAQVHHVPQHTGGCVVQ